MGNSCSTPSGLPLKLTYFNLRGRGEVCRLILAAAGIPYEDNRVETSDWPKVKSTTPYGYMPILEENGEELSESGAVTRFLAIRFGLASSGLERAFIDEAQEVIKSFQEELTNSYAFAPDKAAGLEKFITEKLPGHVKKVETIFARNKTGSGFLVGSKLSYADLHLHCALVCLPDDVLASMPEEFRKNKSKVESIPRIAEYLKNRPESAF